MRKIFLISVIFLLCMIEAHDFKIGDTWYYNSNGVSVDFKVLKVNRKEVLLSGKYKSKDLNLEITLTSQKTIDAKIGTSKEEGKIAICDLVSHAYICRRKTVISRKPINVDEIYVNKYLTLKRGTVMYVPILKNWKRFPVFRNYNVMKFKIENCDKLDGICKAFIDSGDDRIIATIFMPIIDVYNQIEKDIFLEINTIFQDIDEDFSWRGTYYDIAHNLYGTQYDDYFFSKATAKQKGKIFTQWSSGPPMIWFELEKSEINELINRNRKDRTGKKIINYYFRNFDITKFRILSE